MMRLPIRLLLPFLVVVAAVLLMGRSAVGGAVRVTLEVKTEDGKPVQGLAFRALVDGHDPALTDGAVDAQGALELRLEVPAEATSVQIRIGFAPRSTISAADQARLSELIGENLGRFHFERASRIPLDRNRSEYKLAITAHEAVSVSGTFVDREGHPRPSWSLFGPAMSQFGVGGSGQSRPLRGIRKGAAADIAAVVRVGPYAVIRPIRLDATRTQADVDLGAIKVQEPPKGSVIRTKLTGRQQLIDAGVRAAAIPGMTVVSADGKLVATFRARWPVQGADPSAPLELLASEQWKPVLPPGEYLVVPGYFLYDEVQSLVMQLIGKGVDLAKSDIPRIVVRDGAANDDSVDLARCYEALRRLAVREGILTPEPLSK